MIALAYIVASVLVSIVARVAGHHLITTGALVGGILVELIGVVATSILALVGVVKGSNSSVFLRIVGFGLLGFLAWIYCDSLRVSDFPLSIRIAWGFAALAAGALAFAFLLARWWKAAEPSATDNPDDAQRLREDH